MQPSDEWTDEGLVSYIDTHSRTDLALTHLSHVKRFMVLAGESKEELDRLYPNGPNRFINFNYNEKIAELLRRARENLAKQDEKKNEIVVPEMLVVPAVSVVREKKKRIPWDEYFMKIASTVAMRSTCDRKNVGAVIVLDRQILSTGYNGAPRGLPDCDTDGHFMVDIGGRQSCVRTIHAEVNAIVQAARYGVAIKGATMYTTTYPCPDCGRAIINAGIASVVYGSKYDSRRAFGISSEEMFMSAGITLVEMKAEPTP